MTNSYIPGSASHDAAERDSLITRVQQSESFQMAAEEEAMELRHLLDHAESRAEQAERERDEAREECERLKAEADGEFVQAACRIMESNEGFYARDYADGITADDFERFFEEDMDAAWNAFEVEKKRTERAESRIAELTRALDSIRDAESPTEVRAIVDAARALAKDGEG